MGQEAALALLYTTAWIALTVILGVVALARKTKFSIALFGAVALSFPTYVLLVVGGVRFSGIIKESRQQSDAKAGQELCSEVESLPVELVAPGGNSARVVLRPSSAKERDVMPVTAAAIAQEFREIPRLCDKSRLVQVQDDLTTNDVTDRNESPQGSITLESFDICKTRPVANVQSPPTTFALYFTLEKVVRLDAAAGADLRKFGMRLVDLTDMHVVKRSGVVTGPRLLHLPRACLDSASQVSEFLRDALPR